MATAFQATAFQNNAFQIDGDGAQPQPQPDPGSRIVGGTFSRGRWRELVRQWREEAERCARNERWARKKKALERVAEAAREAELIATAQELERIAKLLEAACGARKVAETIRLADEAIALVRNMIDEEEELLVLLTLH